MFFQTDQPDLADICRRTREDAFTLAELGDLSAFEPEDPEDVELYKLGEHLATCEDCQRAVRAEVGVMYALRSLRETDFDQGVLSEVAAIRHRYGLSEEGQRELMELRHTFMGRFGVYCAQPNPGGLPGQPLENLGPDFLEKYGREVLAAGVTQAHMLAMLWHDFST